MKRDKLDRLDELIVPEQHELLRNCVLALAKKQKLHSTAELLMKLVEEIEATESDREEVMDGRSDQQVKEDALESRLDKANRRIAVLENSLDELSLPEKNRLLRNRALALAKKPELRSAAKLIQKVVDEHIQMESDYEGTIDERCNEQLRATELRMRLDKANRRIAVLEETFKKAKGN